MGREDFLTSPGLWLIGASLIGIITLAILFMAAAVAGCGLAALGRFFSWAVS
jgi:hypothetical protein